MQAAVLTHLSVTPRAFPDNRMLRTEVLMRSVRLTIGFVLALASIGIVGDEIPRRFAGRRTLRVEKPEPADLQQGRREAPQVHEDPGCPTRKVGIRATSQFGLLII